MKFEITQEEEKMIQVWKAKHKCPVRGKPLGIGGEITISFTPTGIGTAVEATCICGATLEVREV